MPIRLSASARIRPLIDALGSTDPVGREAAIARLRLLGNDAVEPLLRVYSPADTWVRAGILRALDGVADARLLALAGEAMTSPDQGLQSAAIGTLRHLAGTGGIFASEALDRLVAAALDATQPRETRLAAVGSLRDQPEEVRHRVRDALASEADPELRAAADVPHESPAAWRDMIEGRLPESVPVAQALVTVWTPRAKLTELQHVIDHLRTREQRERDTIKKEEWRALRGRVHQALAARNSRLALYDLRDSLADSARLPVAFLAALEEIGDASCLDPLAAAYDASSRSQDTWWREHVGRAFRAIMERESLTRRHAVVKRVASRWPDAAAQLLAR